MGEGYTGPSVEMTTVIIIGLVAAGAALIVLLNSPSNPTYTRRHLVKLPTGGWRWVTENDWRYKYKQD